MGDRRRSLRHLSRQVADAAELLHEILIDDNVKIFLNLQNDRYQVERVNGKVFHQPCFRSD